MIRCPFLAVGATEENLVLEREVVRLKREEFDEVHVVLVQGRGHGPHQLFGAEEVNTVLEGWLRRSRLLPKAGGSAIHGG